MEDFDRFKTGMLKSVEDIVSTFKKPDDDMLPFAIAEAPDGQRGIVRLNEYFRPKPNRQIDVDIPMLIKQKNVIRMGVAASTWLASLKAIEDAGLINPETDPDREEALAITLMERGGRIESYNALIYRRANKPPVIGSWGPLRGRQLGAFIEPIMEALG